VSLDDRSTSGATTRTVPNSEATSASAAIPRLYTPFVVRNQDAHETKGGANTPPKPSQLTTADYGRADRRSSCSRSRRENFALL
jgi:hypothetical protein